MERILLAAALVLAGCGVESGPPAAGADPAEGDTAFVRFEGRDFVTSAGDTVEIRPFELGRTEVTNRLYAWLAARAGVDLPPDPSFPGMACYIDSFPDHPALNMSALEAQAAAEAIGCRLPTPAEMEYAASQGLAPPVGGQYPWGRAEPDESGFPASYLTSGDWDLRNQDGYLYTAPVASFPLSSEGLADLCGNVAEMTRPDSGWTVLFGGSWLSPASGMKIGTYTGMYEGDRSWSAGFRLAR